jgi:hypothetical protein
MHNNFNMGNPGYYPMGMGPQQVYSTGMNFNSSFDAQQYNHPMGYSPSPQRSLNNSQSGFSSDQFSPINARMGEKKKPQSSHSLKGLMKTNKAKSSLFNVNKENNEKDEEYNSIDEILSKINCEIDIHIKTQKGSR